MLKICLLLAVDRADQIPHSSARRKKGDCGRVQGVGFVRKSERRLPVIWINVVASFIQMPVWWKIVYPNCRNAPKCLVCGEKRAWVGI